MNVLDNAARFAGQAPVSVRGHCSGAWLVLSVSDRGGIGREELERVFEPFHRSEARIRGSGLGLAIAVASWRRTGADFARSRNRVRAAPSCSSCPFRLRRACTRRLPGAGCMSGGTRILVCDDEPQFLRALRVVLTDADFNVVTAASADEALDAAVIRRPQAAIVDLLLPDRDGVEVARSLREWSDMPIVMLSAVWDEGRRFAP